MGRKREGHAPGPDALSWQVDAGIRFSEVDALGIVWHGNFVKYLEDGREAFGREYGLGYQHIYDQGWLTPIVRLEMDYKEQVRYGDALIIETTWIPDDAARIRFTYRILRKTDGCLVLTASSSQVFLNKQGELELCKPAFYVDWEARAREMIKARME